MGRRSPLALLAAVALCVGCAEPDVAGSAGAPPSGARLADAPRGSYRPPADSRLTREQVQAFVEVLERAVKAPAPPAPAPASGGGDDADPLEVTAARQAGVNVEEFFWVRERVLEAEAALTTRKLDADVLAMLEKTLSDLRARREQATDDGSRQLLDEQLAQFQAEAERVRKESRREEPAHVLGNGTTIAPFRERIGALQSELDRRLAALRPPPARSPAVSPPAPR